METLAD